MKTFMLLSALLISLIGAFFLTVAVLLGPLLTYYYFSPSGKDGCSAVRAGLTRQQVIEAVNTSSTPYSEYRDAQDRLIFRGPHSACTISFDPASGAVVNIEKNPTGYHEFLVEAAGDH